jgi:hypothetical protein
MGAITEKAPSPFGGVTEDFELTPPTPKKRNHTAEAMAAKARRVEGLVKIRRLRDDLQLGRNMVQMSQAFIACSVLPYVRTKEQKITKTARLGSGETLTVTLSAGARSEMAFGSDRILLYWLFDRAVKTDSRFVPMENIMEFLGDMGLSDSGKNYADLVERLERLFGIVICVERSADGVTEQNMIPMFRRSKLVRGSKLNKESKNDGIPQEFKGRVGMLFDEEFFADLKKYRVPVPLEIIRFSRDRPQMLDTMLFLLWRVFAAQSSSLITWEDVREQHGHPDSNPRRLREVFSEACAMWKIIWPEFNCESAVEGLWIRPPRRGVQLLLEGDIARKLENGQLSLSTGSM